MYAHTHTHHRDRDSVVFTLLSTHPPPWDLAQHLANTGLRLVMKLDLTIMLVLNMA